MPDFHVVALLYRLESSDHVSYAEPPPLVFENEVARFRLEKDQLRSELKLHIGTLEEARALVDPILRGWELEVELARGPGQMRFAYENAEIIDRAPPIPGVISGHVMVTLQDAVLVSTGNLTLTSSAKAMENRQWVFVSPQTPKAFFYDSAVTRMVASRFCRWRASV